MAEKEEAKKENEKKEDKNGNGNSEDLARRREDMKENIEAKKLIDAEISEEMRSAYINYAMSVIVARALPAAEDGL